MCLASMMLGLASCTEKEEAGEFDNWEVRNINFVDSIAKVCNANTDGKWAKFCAFNLDPEFEAQSPNNLHYVYAHKLESGSGTYMPLFNDSVRVHYMGRLMPSATYPEGYVFDKSYSTYTYNPATDVPALMEVAGTVVGYATTLMQMVEGDRWRVYIPYYLCYGKTTTGSIPGYSTLIFDISLARIYKYQIDTDTSWH